MDPQVAQPGRPLAAALAVVLLIVIGLGSLAFGGLVLLLGSELGLGRMEAAVAATGGFTILFGGLAGAAAAGVWRGAGWGWVVALVVALVGLLGSVVALLTSGGQVPLLVGLGLFAGLLACLAAPGARRRAGIG